MHFYIVELCFILKYILKCGYMYIILMCISCFMFFANDLLLFIFILDQGNDVRPKKKKKFKRFSYPSSKWVVKQWRPLATSAMHLAQELLMNV